MEFCIVSHDEVVTGPQDSPRKLRIGERYVKNLITDKAHDQILYKKAGTELLNLTLRKAVYGYKYELNNLDESQLAAKELLAAESQRIRESGFISTVTGEWTGKTTKENILRSSMVSNSSRNAKSNGKGNLKRKYKTTQGKFIELTNDQITDLDTEINGSEGFIQQCYDREFDISALIDTAGPNPIDIKAVYDAEILTGFPAHGEA